MTWHSDLVEQAMELPYDRRYLRRQVASIHRSCCAVYLPSIVSCASVAVRYAALVASTGDSWQSCPSLSLSGIPCGWCGVYSDCLRV